MVIRLASQTKVPIRKASRFRRSLLKRALMQLNAIASIPHAEYLYPEASRGVLARPKIALKVSGDPVQNAKAQNKVSVMVKDKV